MQSSGLRAACTSGSPSGFISKARTILGTWRSRRPSEAEGVEQPILFHYLADQAECAAMVGTLFDAMARGILTVKGVQTFPLAQAGVAHEALESRQPSGPIALVP